jgi:heat shock protein HslJ
MPLLATLALVISACATSPGGSGFGSSAPELAGTHWVVTSIDGKLPLGGPELVADFGSDGRISGDAGCNSFSGPYIQSGSSVTFGELLTSRRACTETARQRQETHLLAILQGESTMRMRRNRLTLRARDGSLVLTRSEQTARSDNQR